MKDIVIYVFFRIIYRIKMPKYDFLIVGAGFFGATCARKLTDSGYKCLIVEKEKTVGGLCADYRLNDIDIHSFGSHVIHTSNEEVYEFLNKYSKINHLDYYVKALNNNIYYSYPCNMNAFSQLYNTKYPQEAKEIITDDIKNYGVEYRRNLEEETIYWGGFKFYINHIKGYFEKIYGKTCKELPVGLFRDIRVDYTYINDFFGEKYVGIPEDGYTKLVENIIGDDIDILLNTDFFKNRESFMNIANFIICTCPIDKFCNYIYGALPWSTVKFELKDFSKETNNFLGFPTLRITDPNNGLIQIDEYKWLTPKRYSNEYNLHTYLMYTYPDKWDPDKKCIYALNDNKSEELLTKYISFVKENFPNVLFGGRQGLFRNLNICESINIAFDLSNNIINNLKEADEEVEAE